MTGLIWEKELGMATLKVCVGMGVYTASNNTNLGYSVLAAFKLKPCSPFGKGLCF